MPNPKNGEKLPALIVFGRFRSSNLNQAAVFLKKDAEAAKKAASDAGLSALEVQTEEHRQAAAALPEGTINAQGRFSLSPASPGIIAELERLLKAATGQGATSASGAKSETASATISIDLWRQLKPGRWFSRRALTSRIIWPDGGRRSSSAIDDGEFLVRWRDDPKEPRASRTQEYIALLHPKLTGV